MGGVMADGALPPTLGFVPDAAHSRAFRDALGSFATGVTLVTITGPDGPMGFVANSFSSLSMQPPLVLWSPAKAASRFAPFATALHFSIHILAEDQQDLITRFVRGGAGFGAGTDRLAHDLTPEGVPLLAGCAARFDCRQHATHDGGDHVIVVGEVLRVMHRDTAALVFKRGTYGRFTALD